MTNNHSLIYQTMIISQFVVACLCERELKGSAVKSEGFILHGGVFPLNITAVRVQRRRL